MADEEKSPIRVMALGRPDGERHGTTARGHHGGLFFKSGNPERLAKWYETHLEISIVPNTYEQQPWHQEAGPTVFAPFKKDTAEWAYTN